MAKKQIALSKKFPVSMSGLRLGKKDTAGIEATGKFDTAEMDANAAQALLAAGQLHCRLDRAIGQLKLLPGDDIPTTVEFDATVHKIRMDLGSFVFSLSFPKSAASANTLAGFAGADATLIVTRTGDLGTVDKGDEDEE